MQKEKNQSSRKTNIVTLIDSSVNKIDDLVLMLSIDKG